MRTARKKSTTAWLRPLLIGTVAALALSTARAQNFNSGSTGAYGPMNITANTTLSLPPDGIFNCTTVNIAAGATLKFTPNALNTPVYLLATGDVTISGTIDVAGQAPVGAGSAGGLGGPGGHQGGGGAVLIGGNTAAGPGLGPGGGIGGLNGSRPYGTGGSFRTTGYDFNWAFGGPLGDAPTYGNSLQFPLIGGSGGGGSYAGGAGTGGGGGGGAILIASNVRITFVTTGFIDAKGGSGKTDGNGVHGAGSGGAIRLVAPTVTGAGKFNVYSGRGDLTGAGRFRIDSQNPPALTFAVNYSTPDAVGSVMMVFPTPQPKLYVTAAAGTNIAENAAAPVIVNLPTGSPAAQTVKVRARDFGGIVPIRVRLVPDNGAAVVVDSTIDNTVNNPAETTVNVTMPLGVAVNVQVYTR